MTTPGPLSPGSVRSSDRPAPPAVSVPSMSVAEKLACEWEARHDVIARGGRLGNPAALAHYCTHTRCEELRHGPHSGAHGTASRPRAPQDPLRSWLRWGEDAR